MSSNKMLPSSPETEKEPELSPVPVTQMEPTLYSTIRPLWISEMASATMVQYTHSLTLSPL